MQVAPGPVATALRPELGADARLRRLLAGADAYAEVAPELAATREHAPSKGAATTGG